MQEIPAASIKAASPMCPASSARQVERGLEASSRARSIPPDSEVMSGFLTSWLFGFAPETR
ncbi:MAG: hypothetical protein M0Z40_04180 [Actinomycetota bacterium]|nr:hypothetical protein [Actinomycetota bacterium]